MARVRIPIAVIDPAGNSVAGASVNIQKRSSGTAATLYQAETGPTTVSNPTTTDSFGRIQAWVDRGSYNAIISGTGLTTYTQPFDAAAAGDLTVDSAWLLPPDFVTVLPTSPSNGQECYFVADAANGIVWHLKYHASSSSAYKWEYIGGPPMFAEHNGSETTAGNSNDGTGTVGYSVGTTNVRVTCPLAGDYMVEFGASVHTDAGSLGQWWLNIMINGAQPGSGDPGLLFNQVTEAAGGDAYHAISRRAKKTATSASTTFDLASHRWGMATPILKNRFLVVTPIRLG